MKQKVIVVDDDPINNLLCTYNINKVIEDADTKCFEEPSDALKFISSEYVGEFSPPPTILFLDINMPEMDGWDFLNEYENIGHNIHQQINPKDRERANANNLVYGFYSKPLNKHILQEVFSLED